MTNFSQNKITGSEYLTRPHVIWIRVTSLIPPLYFPWAVFFRAWSPCHSWSRPALSCFSTFSCALHLFVLYFILILTVFVWLSVSLPSALHSDSMSSMRLCPLINYSYLPPQWNSILVLLFCISLHYLSILLHTYIIPIFSSFATTCSLLMYSIIYSLIIYIVHYLSLLDGI